MKTKLILLFTLVLALQINPIFAQGCEDTPPPAAKETSDGEVKVEAPKSNMTFFGYIQPQYNNYFTDDASNTFNFKRARFGVRGRVNEDFSYYVMLETSAFIAGDKVYLLDAFVTYDKLDWAKFSLGSFKTPFGLDVTTACHNLATIERSIVADQIVSPQRDLGVMMLGESGDSKFKYSVALMNGRGLGVVDNNTKKDVTGRATYQLFDFLTVGGSFRYGYPVTEDKDRTTYGVEMAANYKKLYLQGEFIYDEGDYNRAAGGGCGATPLELGEKRHGAYFLATYDVTEKLQPVFKYEYFDQDEDLEQIGYSERMTIGLNYFFNDKVRLQVNYLNNIETGLTVDNDALLMQLQLKL